MSSSGPSPAVKEWRLPTQFLSEHEKQHFPRDADPEIWLGDKEIGRGAFGAVWRETCVAGPRRGQVRAVKQILKAKTNPQFLNRELEILSLFGTKNNQFVDLFVQFGGWFVNNETIFIALEFVPHGDLEQHIADKRLHDADAVAVIDQVARALKCLHEGGFAHRDLKPENILVARPRPDWKVKLTDFGVSKNFAATELRTFAGTGSYMAPEVHEIHPGLNPSTDATYTTAADIWSLGAVAYCTQIGKPPFFNGFEIGRFMAGETTFPVAPFRFCIPVFAEFVQDLMRKKPGERPSAAQVLQHEWIASRMQPQSNESVGVGSDWGTEENVTWSTTVQSGYSSMGSANVFGATDAAFPGGFGSSTVTRKPVPHGVVNVPHPPSERSYQSGTSYQSSRDSWRAPSWSTASGGTSGSGRSFTAYKPPGLDQETVVNRSADSQSWATGLDSQYLSTGPDSQYLATERESQSLATGPDSRWIAHDSWDPASASYPSQSIHSDTWHDEPRQPSSLRPGPPSRAPSSNGTRGPGSQPAGPPREPTTVRPRDQSSEMMTRQSSAYAPASPVEKKYVAYPQKPKPHPQHSAAEAESEPAERKYIAYPQKPKTHPQSSASSTESQPAEQKYIAYPQKPRAYQSEPMQRAQLPEPTFGLTSMFKEAPEPAVPKQDAQSPYSQPDFGLTSSFSPFQEAPEPMVQTERETRPYQQPSTVIRHDSGLYMSESSHSPSAAPEKATSRNAPSEKNPTVRFDSGYFGESTPAREEADTWSTGPAISEPTHDHKDSYLTCLRCGTSFSSRDDLFHHIEEQQHAIDPATGRSEYYERPPEYSGRRSYVPEPDTAQHINKDHYLTCLRCGTSFGSRDDLFHHIEEQQHAVDPATGRSEYYERPPQYSGRRSYVPEPNTAQHVDKDPYLTCLRCGTSFTYRDDLFHHIEEQQHAVNPATGRSEYYERPPEHRGRRGYGSEHPPQDDKSWSHMRPTDAPLLGHLHGHRDVSALTCLTCSATFHSRDELFRHLEEEQHAVDLYSGRRERFTRY